MNQLKRMKQWNGRARAVWLAAVLALSGLIASAQSVPPGKMAFQGFLTGTDGSPVGGANPVKASVVFRIYNSPTASGEENLLWAERQTVVVEKGQYTAILGAGTAVSDEPHSDSLAGVFSAGGDRYLGVTVGAGSEIKPRVQFFATPFTQFSASAQTIVSAGGDPLITIDGSNVGINLDGAPTATLEVGGSVKATSLSGNGAQLTGVSISAGRVVGKISGAQLMDGALSGTHLAGTIGAAQLRDGTVTAGSFGQELIDEMAEEVGGVGSGAIVVSQTASNPALEELGFVNIGPARLDGDEWLRKSWADTPNALAVRTTDHGHSGDMILRLSAWTGSKWIIWGGMNHAITGNHNDGGMFDPALGTWTRMSSVNSPGPRREYQTAWTGSRFLIWGGISSSFLNDGRQYDPVTDTWTTMSAVGAPSDRVRFGSAWTGSEWLIWGGLISGEERNDGAIYNPATDTWRPMAPSPLAGRHDFSSQWTGTEWIIVGGDGPNTSDSFQDGARYNPATDTWTPMPFAPVRSARATSVWTGKEFIYWSGVIHTTPQLGGGRYDPVSNTWKPMSAGAVAFPPRWRAVGIWTGSEMVVLGGHDGGFRADTARYNPETDTWTLVPPFFGGAGGGSSMDGVFTTWTGKEVLWLGNRFNGGDRAVFGYRPPQAAYLFAKP